jgi:hypothetical protein
MDNKIPLALVEIKCVVVISDFKILGLSDMEFLKKIKHSIGM